MVFNGCYTFIAVKNIEIISILINMLMEQVIFTMFLVMLLVATRNRVTDIVKHWGTLLICENDLDNIWLIVIWIVLIFKKLQINFNIIWL